MRSSNVCFKVRAGFGRSTSKHGCFQGSMIKERRSHHGLHLSNKRCLIQQLMVEQAEKIKIVINTRSMEATQNQLLSATVVSKGS
jgi:hypothetical protein